MKAIVNLRTKNIFQTSKLFIDCKSQDIENYMIDILNALEKKVALEFEINIIEPHKVAIYHIDKDLRTFKEYFEDGRRCYYNSLKEFLNE